jgi:hypothetical protein
VQVLRVRLVKPAFLLLALGLILVRPATTGQNPSARTAPVSPGEVRFYDIAEQAGLTSLNVYGGDQRKTFIIETTGNGVIIFDYDNDGWPDIFFPNGSTVEGFPEGRAPTGHLYHNNHDGTFQDVTAHSGLARAGWGQGGCVGDYNNDGYLDLLVTYWGQNSLYRNNGDGTFTDVSAQAGLRTASDEWSTGCSFIDYDRDGKTDIFLSRYVDFSYNSVPRPGEGRFCQWKGIPVECGPRGLKAGANALYRNNGDGTFQDVSEKSGILKTAGCYGFTSLTADFDHDRWPDIYVACDSTANLLYHNNHDGTFTDIAKESGVAYNENGAEQAGMGLSAGDFLHTGYQSIVKTNFSDDTPTLYLNQGGNNLDDVTTSAGLGQIKNMMGWGVQFYDFDNSSWPGIFMANGHVYPEIDGKNLGSSYREGKLVYYNLRNGTFGNITTVTGKDMAEAHSSRGVALGDLFDTGREEAVVNNMNQPPSLYYNDGPCGNWISLQLVGVKSNRAGLGARVTLVGDSGTYEQEVRSGGGFISQSDLRLHFGLGSARKAAKVIVRWPSGLTETLADLPANQFYVVREGSGIDSAKTRGASSVRLAINRRP